MGSHGPIPKRSDQRRRMNKDGGTIDKAPGAAHVVAPEADAGWHEIARDWFEALGRSGQSAFYEPSDWAQARYVAEAMSRNLSAGRFSAQLFAAVMAGTTSLLTTEGDRRRLRLELERAAPADADDEAAVTALAAYRDRLSG